MIPQQRRNRKTRLTLTLLVGLIIISTLGCAVKSQKLKTPLPPRPQIRINNVVDNADTFQISRADLIKLEEYIAALERAAK